MHIMTFWVTAFAANTTITFSCCLTLTSICIHTSNHFSTVFWDARQSADTPVTSNPARSPPLCGPRLVPCVGCVGHFVVADLVDVLGTTTTQVAEKPQRTMARGVVRESDDVVRAQRQQRREQAAAEEEEEAAGGGWAAGLVNDEARGEGTEEGAAEGGQAEGSDEGEEA